MIYVYLMLKALTTRQAAKDVGISLVTLQRWIATGRVEALPLLQIRNGRATRLWNSKDLAHLRKIKRDSYWQGRGKRKEQP